MLYIVLLVWRVVVEKDKNDNRWNHGTYPNRLVPCV